MTYIEDSSGRLDLVTVLCSIVIGYIVGHTLYTSELWYPGIFIKCLKIDDTLLMKIILSYLGFSMIENSIMSMTGNDQVLVSTRDDGALLGIFGAALSGVGMYMSQTDPMLVLVQIGQGSVSAGTLTGILIAVMTVSTIGDNLRDDLQFSKSHFYDYFRGKYWQFALPLGIGIYILAAFIDTPRFRFSHDAIDVLGMIHSLQSLIPGADNQTLSPYTIGIVLSISQFAFRNICGKRVQGYAGWISSINYPSNMVLNALGCDTSMFVRYTGSIAALWTLILNIFVIIGSFATFETIVSGAKVEMKMTSEFVGGFCFMMGAALAGGDMFAMICGVSELHIRSTAALGTMLLTAFLTPTITGEI